MAGFYFLLTCIVRLKVYLSALTSKIVSLKKIPEREMISKVARSFCATIFRLFDYITDARFDYRRSNFCWRKELKPPDFPMSKGLHTVVIDLVFMGKNGIREVYKGNPHYWGVLIFIHVFMGKNEINVLHKFVGALLYYYFHFVPIRS